MRRLRTRLRLLQLLLQLPDLRFCLIERDVLHQNGLRQHIKSVGIRTEFAAQKILGLRVFFLELRLVDLLRQRSEQFLFLGSQRRILRQRQITRAASPD
jgi:hypothetical protein